MKLTSILIMFIPLSSFKIYLYRKIYKYKIDSTCKIGFSYIDSKFLEMKKGCKIGNFNYFRGCERIYMDECSQIRKYNFFNNCNEVYLGANSNISNSNKFQHNRKVSFGIGGNLKVGNKTTIVNNHYFDLTDDISIGNNCTIAGIGTQFWTHGFDHNNNRIQGEIILKNNIYVGASSKFNFGVEVNENNVIGMASVITKSIGDSGCLVAGVPAKVISKLKNEKSNFEQLGNIGDSIIYRKTKK
jgi:acetyltransferase-like isoleucine patch superfamily enzyme